MNQFGTATIEYKEKWILALESGEYEQVQGTLKGETEDGVGFCCLGVWLDLQGVNLVTEPFDEPFGDYAHEGPKSYYEDCNTQLGAFADIGIEMNDSGKSFKEIAEAAREFYEINLKEKES